MGVGYNVKHGGGPALAVLVDDTGETVVLPDQSEETPNRTLTRQYALIVAPLDNAGTVYLILHPTLPAVLGAGIPLPPGAYYEITEVNLYQGPIRAIAPPGTHEPLCIQAGG